MNLIADQTNIYGKQKERKNRYNNAGRWEDVGTKDIESFLGIIIMMAVNNRFNKLTERRDSQ